MPDNDQFFVAFSQDVQVCTVSSWMDAVKSTTVSQTIILHLFMSIVETF